MVNIMTVNFSSVKPYLLPFMSRNAFSQLIRLLMLSLLVSIPSVNAEEKKAASFASEFEALTENNLPQYVSQMSHRYYSQVELLGKYFDLYQQRNDPRGFNVWHLRGFSPNFSMLDAENQLVASANEEFLAERPEKALTTIFAELKDVSVNLMLAFRDNDPQAFKAANAKVEDHSAQIAALLKAHGLDKEIREISLN
jgi:hypothetical protein|tara:strand:+ start:2973 stop:3563 length:591 start_codon:yes stop_codon:yes gene_type:complete